MKYVLYAGLAIIALLALRALMGRKDLRNYGITPNVGSGSAQPIGVGTAQPSAGQGQPNTTQTFFEDEMHIFGMGGKKLM